MPGFFVVCGIPPEEPCIYGYIPHKMHLVYTVLKKKDILH